MSATAVAVQAAPSLESWTDRKLDSHIKRGHVAAGKHSSGYKQAAAVTGWMLQEKQRRLGPRKFRPWLNEHFDGSHQTAYRYMEEADAAALSGPPMDQIDPSRGQLANQSGGTDSWSTPDDFFAVIDAEFGFEIDVCALDSSAKCERYFTPEDDGLAQDWAGVCWMNPPYGNEIVEWVRKAYESAQAGATVVCLVPARVDTGWWWDFCRHGEIRFLRGRLKFGGADTSAPFPSALVVFGRPATTVYWEWQA